MGIKKYFLPFPILVRSMGISLPRISIAITSIIFFLLLTATLKASVNVHEQPREVFIKLIGEARAEEENKNYAVTLEKLLKAELIAEQHQWDDLLSNVKNRIGLVYFYISNYGEALDYFQESYTITQKHENLYESGIAALGNIGFLYAKEKKYEEALHYFKKAYDLAKKASLNNLKKEIANNIAEAYNELGDAGKSFEILKETEEPVNNVKTDFLWKAVYIKALLIDGQIGEAQNLAEKLYEELDIRKEEDYREECYTCLVSLLSQIYAKQGKIDLAILYAYKELKINEELIDRIKLYENISGLYLKKNDYKSAFKYKDSALLMTNDLSARTNRNLYELNKAKLKVNEYQNELNVRKKKHKAERQLFIILAILGLVLLFLTYKVLKIKVEKQKQKDLITSLELEKERKEHLLTEKQLETTLLKEQQLKHKVAEKNRELASKALYFSKRNELIQNIIESIENDNRFSESKDTVKQIKAIKNFLKAENYENNFMLHFERVNPMFLKRLKEKHTKLTANDIRFLCYIYMNLSLKEISAIFNITYDTCRKRRRRIMDKMKLEEKSSLYEYLLKI